MREHLTNIAYVYAAGGLLLLAYAWHIATDKRAAAEAADFLDGLMAEGAP